MFSLMTLGVGMWVRFLHLRRFARQYLSTEQPFTILDAGFGQGDYLAWFARVYPSATLVGYDLATEMHYQDNLQRAQNKIGNAEASLQLQDLLQMSDENRFDVVYSIDVLEHIPNNRVVMENVYTALKPGGYFYLSMPYQYGKNILPRRVFEHFEAWAEEEHIGEMRSVDETSELCQKIGYKVLEAQYIFTVVARFAWELEQATRNLRGMRPRRFLLNIPATLEMVLPPPKIGSIRMVLQKPEDI